MSDDIPLLAAIPVEEAGDAVPLLRDILAALKANGRSVAGNIQREIAADGICCPDMVLEDIETGELHCISQSLGPGASACRLDSQALAMVAGRMLVNLDTLPGPDLLLLNRFGKAEAEGRGLRAVFEKAASLGVPVLTCVKQDYRAAWADYTGPLSTTLAATPEDVLAWCRSAITCRQKAEQ